MEELEKFCGRSCEPVWAVVRQPDGMWPGMVHARRWDVSHSFDALTCYLSGVCHI